MVTMWVIGQISCGRFIDKSLSRVGFRHCSNFRTACSSRNTTSFLHYYNVHPTSRRVMDVVTTIKRRRVPAGHAFSIKKRYKKGIQFIEKVVSNEKAYKLNLPKEMRIEGCISTPQCLIIFFIPLWFVNIKLKV